MGISLRFIRLLLKVAPNPGQDLCQDLRRLVGLIVKQRIDNSPELKRYNEYGLQTHMERGLPTLRLEQCRVGHMLNPLKKKGLRLLSSSTISTSMG